MKDGGLRQIFRQQFRQWQWSTIEVGAIAGGIPDNEYCTPSGYQAWIEYKQTHIWYIQIKPLQVAWLMRRCRYGGNAWIGVRRWRTKDGADEFWLMKGDQAEALCREGLQGVHGYCWEGGPGNWNFKEIGDMLSGL